MRRIEVMNERLIAVMKFSEKLNEIIVDIGEDVNWQIASLVTKKYDYSSGEIEKIIAQHVISKLAKAYKIKEVE
jgi:hypothetical protein